MQFIRDEDHLVEVKIRSQSLLSNFVLGSNQASRILHSNQYCGEFDKDLHSARLTALAVVFARQGRQYTYGRQGEPNIQNHRVEQGSLCW